MNRAEFILESFKLFYDFFIRSLSLKSKIKSDANNTPVEIVGAFPGKPKKWG